MPKRLESELIERMQRRYGDGQNSSVREVAAEFDVNESTLRTIIDRQGDWPRDWLRHQITVLRQWLTLFDGELERLDAEVVELRGRSVNK